MSKKIKKNRIVDFKPISIEEFKQLFNLKENDVVTEETVFSYCNIVVGLYLLAHEAVKPNVELLKTLYENKPVTIKTHVYESHNSHWRKLIQGMGSQSLMEARMEFTDRDYLVPFWTYRIWDIPELKSVRNKAYLKYDTYLEQLNARFVINYGVKLHYTLNKDKVNHWFYRIYNVYSTEDLHYTNKAGIIKFINRWDIRNSITQSGGSIFLGELPECLNKMLERVEED